MHDWVFIGAYAASSSPGVQIYRFDGGTEELTYIDAIEGLKNPSFVKISDGRHILYTFSQADNGKSHAEAAAFRIDEETGKAALISRQATAAPGATHINLSRDERVLMLVSYGDGIISIHPLGENGEILPLSQKIELTGSGPNRERQDRAHPHSVYPDPTGRFVMVPDLGTDKIMIYRLDSDNARLALHAEIKAAPGAGPRHLAFHPTEPYAYLIEELASRITVFQYHPEKGELRVVQSVGTLPEDYGGTNLCAEILVSPDGRFVYGSNRGHDSIAVFAVDPANGTLTSVEHASTRGKHPRNFGLMPAGRHLFAANKDSNSVQVMRIDKQTGKLAYSGRSLDVNQPTCVRFLTAASLKR